MRIEKRDRGKRDNNLKSAIFFILGFKGRAISYIFFIFIDIERIWAEAEQGLFFSLFCDVLRINKVHDPHAVCKLDSHFSYT